MPRMWLMGKRACISTSTTPQLTPASGFGPGTVSKFRWRMVNDWNTNAVLTPDLDDTVLFHLSLLQNKNGRIYKVLGFKQV